MANHPDAGKPVIIGGDVVGELLACFHDDDTLIEQLRRRAADVGIPYSVIEDIGGLAEGAVGKYISPLRVKKLTLASLMRLAAPLGLRALLYIDPQMVAQVSPCWTKRDSKRVRTRRQPRLGKAQMRRVIFEVAREMARRGGVARMKKLSREQRQAIGRRGAQIRWARRAEEQSRQ
jgi:hypothetical protein